jgi:hypothetical protein
MLQFFLENFVIVPLFRAAIYVGFNYNYAKCALSLQQWDKLGKNHLKVA